MINWWRQFRLRNKSGWRLVEQKNGVLRVEIYRASYWDRLRSEGKWECCWLYDRDQKEEAMEFVRQKQQEWLQATQREKDKQVKRIIL